MNKYFNYLFLLFITVPTWAGPLINHDPKPKSYIPQMSDIDKMGIHMTTGYFIHILDQNPIKVIQDNSAQDPYHTYIGCKTTDVENNFPAEFSINVTGVSAAGGIWEGTITPQIIPPGVNNNVEICVTGEQVNIEALPGGLMSVKVAEVVISVLPVF